MDEQQQQQQEQPQEQQQQWFAAAGVARRLQDLSTGLGLPYSCMQELVLRAPDLLQLAAAGPEAIAAAASALSSSWLLAPASAVHGRQQYQRQLLQLLQPQLYSKGLRKRRVKQQEQHAGGWYDAAQASEDAGLQCQWWRQPQPQQPQQQQQLSPFQQLVLQAPALLALAGQQSQQATALQDSQMRLPAWQPAARRAAELDLRLQLLCDQLLPLLLQDTAAAAALQGLRLPAQQGGHQQHQGRQQQSPQFGVEPEQQPALYTGQQQHQQMTAALEHAAALEPCLLVQSPDWVVVQLQKLSAALQVPLASMVLLFLQRPGLLWLTQAQVFEQVRVLCGVFMLPAQQVKQLVATPDAAPLLLMHQEAVKLNFIAAAAAAGGQAKLRQKLLQRPELLLPGAASRKQRSQDLAVGQV
jgi:hypothetical protein